MCIVRICHFSLKLHLSDVNSYSWNFLLSRDTPQISQLSSRYKQLIHWIQFSLQCTSHRHFQPIILRSEITEFTLVLRYLLCWLIKVGNLEVLLDSLLSPHCEWSPRRWITASNLSNSSLPLPYTSHVLSLLTCTFFKRNSCKICGPLWLVILKIVT